MAREQIDATGAVSATIALSDNATTVSVYDVFASNQGEGAMRVTLDWTAADFSSVFTVSYTHLTLPTNREV